MIPWNEATTSGEDLGHTICPASKSASPRSAVNHIRTSQRANSGEENVHSNSKVFPDPSLPQISESWP